MRRRLLIAAIAFLLLGSGARADLSLVVIEYRVLTDLGQVRLTSTSLHDEAIQDRVVKNREKFERAGIVLVQAEVERVFARKERIGSHTVETRLTIEPAVGRGFRGGLPTAELSVKVDGIPRIDCPYDSGETELHDVAVLVTDGIIHLRGSFKDKTFDETVPLLGGKMIDMYWLMALAQ
jgi:hypothetical protein